MSKGFASTYRIVLLAGGLFLCFAGLGVRLAFLHVVDREAWLATIVKARRQTVVEQARRGDILDRNYAVLATSRSMIVLGVDPRSVVDSAAERQKWSELAAIIGLPEADLARVFTTKARPPVAAVRPKPAEDKSATGPERTALGFTFTLAPPASVARESDDDDDTELDAKAEADGRRVIKWAKLRDDVSEQVYAQIKELKIKGLTGDRVYRRVYPNDQLAAHVIGYVNREERPVVGVEAYADFYLRGQNGWSVGERDGRGRELAQFRTREVPHADGYTVVLSIDSTVQSTVEQELDYIAKKFQPLKATIIVSRPSDGFILAMANTPGFDLNQYNKVPHDEMERMKNVAVTDIYEPGSVFKIVAAAGALEDRLVTPESSFDCSLEKIDYKGRTRGLPKEDHQFGRLTVAQIIAHSSNRGAAQLAMELGDERFYNYARAFGFGRKLGFPIGPEEPGIMHAWKSREFDITRVPMGQAVACTPLQMHQAMSVIAADGVLLRPQIVKEIKDSAGETVFAYRRAEIDRVISPQTARIMARLLTGVASKEGTAPEAAISGYDVAGKTGTAQKYIDGKPSERHHVVSFVGFFPAGRPQVAISVIIDDADAHAPTGVAYGSKVAAPSFKRLGEKLIPILDIKPANETVRPVLFATNDGGRR
jgi:cell division protein FtsI (penicillin-binding protein 3)